MKTKILLSLVLIFVSSYIGYHMNDPFAYQKDADMYHEWKEACEAKWDVPCRLEYVALDGVGVYQVYPVSQEDN